MLDVQEITDPRDERVDDVRDLNVTDRRPDREGGPGLVIAEGPYVVGRMLTSRFRPHLVVATPARLDRLRRDAEAEGRDLDTELEGVQVLSTSGEVLSAVIGFRSSRDVLAVARRPDPVTPDEVVAGARTLLVLEGLNDPENLGSIFRGAAAFGADGVLVGAATSDPLYRRVVRVSMGHVLHVPFAHLPGTPTTWQRGLTALGQDGWRTVALTPGGDVTVAQALAGTAEKVALVVGAEGPGLTEHAMRACAMRARIPMAGGIDSLNVATAATLALYERVSAGARPPSVPPGVPG